MSKGKITYLMGAGASAQALPVLSNFATEILVVKNELERWKDSDEGLVFLKQAKNPLIRREPNKDQEKKLNDALEALQNLYEASINHTTIDTHCRMLKLTRANKKDRAIKNTLALFFQLSAVRKRLHEIDSSLTDKYKALDLRYDSFFASVLQNSFDQLPDQVNILSWNYDDQFERAYSRYLHSAKIQDESPESRLNVFTKFSNSDRTMYFNHDRFFIYKINGSASFKRWKDLDKRRTSAPNHNRRCIRCL
ncbi:MAG: hypothetical protein EOP04_18405 [Proteobacteria bacterium]|nr:MAG: hypothetical protein EOP04_18405 [Pseudomonadota bacterium]